MIEITIEAKDSLERLRTTFAALRDEVSKPLEWPMPATRLGLESRAQDASRTFKHIQQMCLLHTSSFRNVNQIKLVYLIEAYLAVVDAKTPLGIYSAARSLLEFAAFNFDVARRLSNASEGNSKDWLARGQAFFGVIVRAAFGSSDPKAVALLLEAGTAKEHTKPFHINDSLKSFGKEKGSESTLEHYDMLCDFVHHNLSSGTITATSIRYGTVAHSHGGGMLLLSKPGAIICRRFPAPDQVLFAMNQTAAVALMNVEAAVRWINKCPESPFTPSEILNMTGHEFGMAQLRPSVAVRPDRSEGKDNWPKTGRNDLCPCGSGKKFKRCCLTKSF